MTELADRYEISAHTMALEPYAHPFYQTKILDTRGTFFSAKTPLQLIQESCLMRNYSTYEGKRLAIRNCCRFKQNIPIPIDHQHYICAIPTRSPSSWSCSWLFYAHIEKLERHEFQHTNVYFRNGQTQIFPISFHQMELQWIKAGHILAKLNLLDKMKFSTAEHFSPLH
ncbi:competence protein ComK [Bacillus rhizoplanae]|uniref:competence protein ComK n=1 Tax=Bacillus rhizoplanae TaxID=2880966 RepID=UPI003D2277D2